MEKESVKIPMYGNGKISVENLTKEELDKLRASLLSGAYYAKGENGRIVFVPTYEKLPDPIKDEKMLPFWREHEGEKVYQAEMFEAMHSKESVYSPSITIRSLCGYHYTPAFYKEIAEKLESYGFEVLRSQRGDDFRYTELWILSGLWAAKGDLKEVIKNFKGEEQLKKTLKFLRRNVSFGSLDVSTQRMAMVMED